MIDKNLLLKKITAYQGNKSIIVDNQNTSDIINSILSAHKKYASDYDKIASQFWRGSAKETCRYIWSFLKANVKYRIEPDSSQSVKSPAAILLKNGDCKHYSQFFGGVLDALKRQGYKIDWCYRFANYKLFNTAPHHVFVVLKNKGIETWCDAVLSGFDYKKSYINKIDKNMSLYSISGLGCDCENENSFGAVRLNKAARQQKRRGGEGCTGRTAAKYNPVLFAARKAFLLLVRTNVKKFAVKLHNKLKDPRTRTELLKKWCGAGGTAKQLELTVNKAYAKYARKNPSKVGVVVESSIAATIAAATPIIALLAKFLGGERGEEISQAVTEAGAQFEARPATVEGTDKTNMYILYGALGIGAYYFLTKRK
jgi:hypothetical protein